MVIGLGSWASCGLQSTSMSHDKVVVKVGIIPKTRRNRLPIIFLASDRSGWRPSHGDYPVNQLF